MFVVDTNILVYAADVDSEFHGPCRALLDQWRAQTSAWFLTWGIVFEFLRVTTHPRVFCKPWPAARAWSFVEALLASPALGLLIPGSRHPQVVAEIIREVPHAHGNLMHDLATAALMREHGIKTVYTRDTDFHRFRFLDVVDPVR